MSKLTKYLIAVAATAIILFLVWYFSSIVAYILVSAVLAIIGKPLVDTLRKVNIRGRRMPQWLAALVTLLAIWAVAVLFLTLFIPLVFHKVNELASLDINAIIASFHTPLQSLQESLERIFAIDSTTFSLVDEMREGLREFLNIGAINSALSSTASLLAGTVVALFSITFITFFFLKEDKLFQNMVVAVFPKKYEENIVHALESITNLLIRYFTGILAESAIIMLLLSGVLMLWGFGAETAFFMGLVMGILNVIPYIGPLIGAGICIAVGVVSPLEGFSMLQMAMVVGGMIACVKCLDDFVLQPTLYSNRVKAHPLEIFIVILIAGSVAGVLGMLLAIPAYNVIRVFAKEFFYNFRLVQKLTENI